VLEQAQRCQPVYHRWHGAVDNVAYWLRVLKNSAVSKSSQNAWTPVISINES